MISLAFCVRSRRSSSLLSIYAHFPKLDVAGSIPVSRSKINNLEDHEKGLPHFCRVKLIYQRRFQRFDRSKPTFQRCLCVGVQIDVHVMAHQIRHNLRIDSTFTEKC